MSTVAVARKGGTVAIASDSLVTFGETRLPHGYEANAKMFAVAGSWVGAVGSTAHLPVLRQALQSLPADELRLHSRDGLFETFVRLHPRLKESYFLNTKEQESDPYGPAATASRAVCSVTASAPATSTSSTWR